jgi:hypothetical protein
MEHKHPIIPSSIFERAQFKINQASPDKFVWKGRPESHLEWRPANQPPVLVARLEAPQRLRNDVELTVFHNMIPSVPELGVDLLQELIVLSALVLQIWEDDNGKEFS